MPNQKAPFKYHYSFNSDQKCHPCKATLFFLKPNNIQGSSLSQNYERQHFGIYHSHTDHWKFLFISRSFTMCQKERIMYTHNFLLKPLPGGPGRCNVGRSLGYDQSCHSQKDYSSTWSQHHTSFTPLFFLFQKGWFFQHDYLKKKREREVGVGGKERQILEISETDKILWQEVILVSTLIL